mmetsp:Transcript_34612/g.75519  ORF Transcript_34612/g.75519 Transcript_34612/m.75519 type:complete len:752 (+) Transcript_34612:62-2317(+)
MVSAAAAGFAAVRAHIARPTSTRHQQIYGHSTMPRLSPLRSWGARVSYSSSFRRQGAICLGGALGVRAITRKRQRLHCRRPLAARGATAESDAEVGGLAGLRWVPRPTEGYVFEGVLAPVALTVAVSFLLYPLVSLALAALLDETALSVIKGDVSQFMQNFFNYNGLLFSFFISATYTFLYSQQENVYLALYAEVAEARSLMEQITLVSQGRPNYKALLKSMQEYVEELLLGVQFGCPPATLLSARPVNDPLENILYLTSVGLPSAVYDTVRSLRQTRGNRLGATQRKLPDEHFVLLYFLGAMELLAFPLLGAGISTYEPVVQAVMPGHVLSFQSVVFALLAGCVMMALRVVEDLRSPTSGLYSITSILDEMVGSLNQELDNRLRSAPKCHDIFEKALCDTAEEDPDSALLHEGKGSQTLDERSRPGSVMTLYGTGQPELTGMWSSIQPQSDKQSVTDKVVESAKIAGAAAIAFFILVPLLRGALSDGALLSIREDNNAQWLQNFFTGISFIFSLFVANTFSFLYGQQEAIYMALYAEVSEAKALLEQLALVCRCRPSYGEMLKGLQDYVREDLQRLDRSPTELLSAGASVNDPLEGILYATSVGVPSAVYDTVKGLRQARGARLGATQRKLPDAHYTILQVMGALELSIFPILASGCAALDASASLPGHIVFFHAVLFGLMSFVVTLTLLVLADIWNPVGDIYNLRSVLAEMVSGLQGELKVRLAEHEAATFRPEVDSKSRELNQEFVGA